MSRDPRDAQGVEPADGAPADRPRPIDPTGEDPRPGGRAVGVPTPRDPAAPIDPERSTVLLTAYIDGVAELPPDERHDVEAHLARDPGARTNAEAVHALLDRLRALPPEGGDPDWAAMERSIRQAVATAPARPWWRRWQWLVPAMTCATAAAVLLVIWPHDAPPPIPQHPQHLQRPPNAEPAGRAEPGGAEPPAGDSVVALWLDGSEVDVDVSAPAELGDVGGDVADIADSQPIPLPSEDAGQAGLLPATGLVWVDNLDDAALDRVERWLANPEHPAGANHPGRPQGPERRKKI